jgi:hypothetical protein
MSSAIIKFAIGAALAAGVMPSLAVAQGNKAGSSAEEALRGSARASKQQAIRIAPRTTAARKRSSNYRAAMRSTANDIWVGTDGGWHMTGASGRGIYYGFSGLFDEAYTFADDLPVGGLQGWTYKEVGFNVWIFFSASTGGGGCSGERPYELLWSSNNVDFNHFQCAR